MKKLIVTLILTILSVGVFSQQKITYAYDAAGNRVKREIIMVKSAKTEVLQTVYTEEIAKRNIKIYPNPTDGYLRVEIDNIENMKNGLITIVTLNTGSQVAKKKITENIIDLDISNRAAGLYIMFIDIDGERTSWKIMKK